MKAVENMLLFMGAAFALMGGVAIVIVLQADENPGAFILIPLLFVVIGLAFLASVMIAKVKRRNVVKKGKKIAAKIYGYVNNTSVMVNGRYTIDTKVHYFDGYGQEKEVVLPTGFTEGSGGFPIGMTIDIYEYNGKYGYDAHSVRDEVLPGENELMDDKPVEPDKKKIVAVTCTNCGASFEATAGYSNKCPFCGGYINV